MKKGMIQMFKCYDNVVGEIVEAYDKSILLGAMQDRWEIYKEQGKRVQMLCVKGEYFIAEI